MKSRIITLISKKVLDFSYLATTSTQTVVLRKAVRVVGFYDLMLLLRVHNKNMVANTSFTFSCLNTFPSKQDPQEFTDTVLVPLSISLTSSGGTPALVYTPTTNSGPYMKAQFLASRGATTGPFYAEVSLSLMGRPR